MTMTFHAEIADALDYLKAEWPDHHTQLADAIQSTAKWHRDTLG